MSNKDCSQYGKNNNHNIIAISTYISQNGIRRIFQCKSCQQMFSETRDTVFFDLRTPEEKVMMALKMILVQVGLSDISFVLGVKEDTALIWLNRAYKKAEEINRILFNNLPVTEVQLDEMWSFVRRKISDKATDEKESPERAEDGRQWIWISYAPQFRLILATVVGPRTYHTALMLIQATARIITGIPCFFSDGYSCYLQALIECYHTIKIFPRTGNKGRPKDPMKEPHPDLVYGVINNNKISDREENLKK